MPEPVTLAAPTPTNAPSQPVTPPAAAEAVAQEKTPDLNAQPTPAAPATVQTPAPVASAVESAPAKPEEAKVSYFGKGLQTGPIEAPPLPISSVKQTQLQALLAKYKAELITAGQYQAERTKILAEP